MGEATVIERAVAAIAADLLAAGRRFALVGGLAVSVRAEVRFTRDVDVAVAVDGDPDAERLVLALRERGYRPVASVEHETRSRLATARLLSPLGVKVDLLFASSGIEAETVARAERLELPSVGEIPVARAEELLALKVLSMTAARLQDRLDAQHLLRFNPGLDMDAVRENLAMIRERGFERGQVLEDKLAALVAEVRGG
jgi:nucleotidyltransferase AbiEii toxin of type IV toxin-antitoxin system